MFAQHDDGTLVEIIPSTAGVRAEDEAETPRDGIFVSGLSAVYGGQVWE